MDVEHFILMMEWVIENCGDVPRVTTADAGYISESNVITAALLGIDAYVATGRAQTRGRAGMEEWAPEERLRTKKGRAVYARRKAVAKPPFGQIKQARGFDSC